MSPTRRRVGTPPTSIAPPEVRRRSEERPKHAECRGDVRCSPRLSDEAGLHGDSVSPKSRGSAIVWRPRWFQKRDETVAVDSNGEVSIGFQPRSTGHNPGSFSGTFPRCCPLNSPIHYNNTVEAQHEIPSPPPAHIDSRRPDLPPETCKKTRGKRNNGNRLRRTEKNRIG